MNVGKPASGLAPPAARVVFVDIARTFATLMMLQGHTIDALLATSARTGTAFELWTFARGFTSCMFLLLSGFAFAVASSRRWSDHVSSPAVIGRRFGRFGLFFLLGYALHAPAAEFSDFATADAERWRAFFAVDILQCIAAMLCALQLLVLMTRTPRLFSLAALAGCVSIVVLTPMTWRTDWSLVLPAALAPYLSSSTGSAFPLLPWGAYVLFGAFLGMQYVLHPQATRLADRMLLGAGIVFVVAAFVGARIPLQPLGQTDFWFTSPNLFLLRTGVVLMLLGIIALASRNTPTPGPVVRAVAQESLTIYVIHLCIVYGSQWAPGLREVLGPTLPLWLAVIFVVVLLGAMIVLAMTWSNCKTYRPNRAWQVRMATFGVLFGKFL